MKLIQFQNVEFRLQLHHFKVKSTRVRIRSVDYLQHQSYQSKGKLFIHLLDNGNFSKKLDKLKLNNSVDANRSSATNSSRSVNSNNSQNGGALPLYKSDSLLIQSNETPRSNGEQEKVEIDIYDLDSIAISIHYSIHCLDSYDDLSYYISQKCWDKLTQSEYQTNDGLFFPDLEPSLLVMISAESFSKMRPSYISAAPNVKIPDVPITSRSFRLSLGPNAWNHTVHYLAPGKIGKIKAGISCAIQIGSQFLQLFLKEGPWKRYPVITHRVTIHPNEELQIASPFGGICYIISQLPVPGQFTFTDF